MKPNMNRHGLAVERYVPKDKSLLYEFEKRGTDSDGYVYTHIFTKHRADFKKLKKQGYRYVRAFEVARG